MREGSGTSEPSGRTRGRGRDSSVPGEGKISRFELPNEDGPGEDDDVRVSLVALASLFALGCGGKVEIEAHSSANGGSSADASNTSDTSLAHADSGPAPVPVCKGKLAQCVLNDAGHTAGEAIVYCDPVDWTGAWTLLLEREINGQFVVVQVTTSPEPGFAVVFHDSSGPPAWLTYRVCATDDQGTRCADPSTTNGPPNCGCVPYDCDLLQACNKTASNGCGGTVHCDKCSNGSPCNLENHSCCPPGEQSDGTGGCECAPEFPCKNYWDPKYCNCVNAS